MTIGFGRVVVGDTVVDDPYGPPLEDADEFEVISDAGPRYRVVRVAGEWDPSWVVDRVEPAPEVRVGSIVRGGHRTGYVYSARRAGSLLASSQQSLVVNAVFVLMGDIESRSAS